MRRWFLILGLLIAACGGATEESTTTALPAPTAEASQSTTSTTTPETTSASTRPVVLAQSNATTIQPIEPDRTYTYDLNPVSLTFQFAEAGWQLVTVGSRSLTIGHADEPLAVFFSFRPGETPDQLLDELRSLSPDLTDLSFEPAELGGASAVVADLPLGPPEADGPTPWMDSGWACGGYPLVEERILNARVSTILNPCSINRFWVIGFDEVAVFVNILDHSGTKERPATLDDLEPLIDEFLAAITFNP